MGYPSTPLGERLGGSAWEVYAYYAGYEYQVQVWLFFMGFPFFDYSIFLFNRSCIHAGSRRRGSTAITQTESSLIS